MKSGRIYWASVFITIGVLGVLDNLAWLSLDWVFWSTVWPAALILLGAAILLRTNPWKGIFVAATGALTALVFFSMFLWTSHEVHSIGSSVRAHHPVTQTLVETWEPGIERASLHFAGGAGHFTFGDTSAHLLAAEAGSSFGRYSLSRSDTGGTAALSLTMEDGEFTLSDDDEFSNSVDVRLHPSPAWDFDFDIGAATADFDLRPWIVRSASIEAGAASIRLTLGSRAPESRVTVNAGAASITIRVPKDAECEVRMDAQLSKRSFDGFTSAGPGLWRSAGTGRSPKRIFVDLSAGVSSIAIERYDDRGDRAARDTAGTAQTESGHSAAGGRMAGTGSF